MTHSDTRNGESVQHDPRGTLPEPFYEDEFATIYHADCRDILRGPFLGWDVVVTDPPYFGREDLFDTSAVDEGMRLALSENRKGFVFWSYMGQGFPGYPDAVARGEDGAPDAIHVWHKSVPIHPKSVTGNVAGHHYERILAYGLGARCEVFRYPAIMPNFAACAVELTEHPTQKPVDLVRLLVSRTKGVVLDPFMGSGTTLRAAKDLSRHAIGIEVEERYCDIAAERLAQGVLDFGGVA